MRSRKEGVRLVGRAFAGRRLGVALATAGLLGLSLTSAVVAVSCVLTKSGNEPRPPQVTQR